MGNWGVKSYENDEAADALDAGFDRVHGTHYEELMDDRNPLSFEQVQQKLADPRTLDAAIEAVREALDLNDPPETWDELARLALVGIVVRHAELGVPIPETWCCRAIDWLENEEIDWEEETVRRLRRRKEIDLLKRAPRASSSDKGQPSESFDNPPGN
jgi:hypothetical protein